MYRCPVSHFCLCPKAKNKTDILKQGARPLMQHQLKDCETSFTIVSL